VRLGALLLVLLLSAGSVDAHGPVPIQPSALWQTWSFDPIVLVPLLVAHWAYGHGTVRLWARAGRWRGIGRTQVLSFLTGEAVLVVALVSPLDELGGTLMSAHMAQHALLIAVAPPLLLFGRSGVAFAWALPACDRRSFFASRNWRTLARLANALSRPVHATSLHGLALWAWHASGAFDAALASSWLHALEHASFFGTALLFWRALGNARSARHVAAALGAAFFTLVHSGLLGALIVLSPRPLYGWYGATELWTLSALEDQQLAGLLMWVPMGGVYFATCLYLASRLFVPEERYTQAPADLSRVEQRPP
jgi:putative membrane protein